MGSPGAYPHKNYFRDNATRHNKSQKPLQCDIFPVFLIQMKFAFISVLDV